MVPTDYIGASEGREPVSNPKRLEDFTGREPLAKFIFSDGAAVTVVAKVYYNPHSYIFSTELS